MIVVKKGNLLDSSGIIVHGCNCQGVMGSGVAFQIRKRWPEVYEKYIKSPLVLGSISSVEVRCDLTVVNGLTQKYYGRSADTVYVDYDAVKQVFTKVNALALANDITVVNFPLIGCGLANGDWNIVSEIIDTTIDNYIEKVLWIYEG